MSVRRIAKEQPDHFQFTSENLAWAQELIAKYPEGKQRSAVIPLLWRAQEQNDGWTSEPAMRTVADMLDMAYIRVYEVATFYTMFQLSPVGKKAHVQVCGTTPCMLRGAKDLIEICKRRIAKTPHTLSADGDFSWEEVECLGACVNAPMIQIFKDTYEDLDEKSLEDLLDAFARGEKPKPGPQVERDLSCPQGGLTSLFEVPEYVPLNLEIGKEAETNLAQAAAMEVSQKLGIKAAVGVVKDKKNETSKDEVSNKDVSKTDQKQSLEEKPEDKADKVKVAGSSGAANEQEGDSGLQPIQLDGPRNGQADDLKMIKGVGPKLEQTLNGLGIYHFDQIASWSRENIAWVDESLSFKGRIDREDWLAQAKTLAQGLETEFSKRASYDDPSKGEA